MLMKTSFASVCTAAVFTMLLLAPNPAAAQLINGGFESPDATGGDVGGAESWDAFGPVFTTAAVARTGLQAAKTFGPFVQFGGAGATQAVPASPGDTFVGEIYALNASFDPIDSVDFGVYKIEFRDAAGNLAAGGLAGVDIFESNPIDASAPFDQWQLLGVGTAPAPANTTSAVAVFVKVDIDGAGGGSIFWDDATLMLDGPVSVESTSFGKIKQLYR